MAQNEICYSQIPLFKRTEKGQQRNVITSKVLCRGLKNQEAWEPPQLRREMTAELKGHSWSNSGNSRSNSRKSISRPKPRRNPILGSIFKANSYIGHARARGGLHNTASRDPIRPLPAGNPPLPSRLGLFPHREPLKKGNGNGSRLERVPARGFLGL